MIRPARGAVLLAVAAGIACLAVPGAASAAPAAEPTAIVRGAHFSPDTPGVDVYLTAFSGGTSTLWLSSVGYGDVSAYRRLTAGLYAVSMRPHGQPASVPAALTWTLDAHAGSAYTAAAVGLNAQLHGIVLRDELTPPASGSGRVRVIQAASRAAHASLTATNGPVVTADAAFATSTAYATVPAGSWPLVARSDATPALTATSTVTISAGSVNSVVLLDAKGAGLTLRAVTDAAGAAVAPVGAVPAGDGGTATVPARDDRLAYGALAGGVLLAASGVLVMRRSRRRPVS